MARRILSISRKRNFRAETATAQTLQPLSFICARKRRRLGNINIRLVSSFKFEKYLIDTNLMTDLPVTKDASEALRNRQ